MKFDAMVRVGETWWTGRGLYEGEGRIEGK